MGNCTNIGRYDITCLVQNQDFTSVLTWKVGDQPFDLSIYQNIYFDVFDYNRRVFRKQLGDGLEISGANNEILTLSINQVDTLLLNKPNYTHEFRFLTGTNENNYLINGDISVTQTKSR